MAAGEVGQGGIALVADWQASSSCWGVQRRRSRLARCWAMVMSRGGDVEGRLVAVAEPDGVAGADLAMCGQADRDGPGDAAAGGAPEAAGSSPDGAVVPGGGEGGEGAGKAAGACAGQAGKRVQGLGLGWDEHVVLGPVVAAAGLGGEPGGQDGEHLGEGEVVGEGQPGQVGGERLPGDRGDGPRQGWRVTVRAGGEG
jgi:hypothetical protein